MAGKTKGVDKWKEEVFYVYVTGCTRSNGNFTGFPYHFLCSGLSLMATYNPDGVIRGLDSFPPNERPNPIPIHLAFDGMVGSGLLALFIAVLFWVLYFVRKRVIPENRWPLRGILLAA